MRGAVRTLCRLMVGLLILLVLMAVGFGLLYVVIEVLVAYTTIAKIVFALLLILVLAIVSYIAFEIGKDIFPDERP